MVKKSRLSPICSGGWYSLSLLLCQKDHFAFELLDRGTCGAHRVHAGRKPKHVLLICVSVVLGRLLPETPFAAAAATSTQAAAAAVMVGGGGGTAAASATSIITAVVLLLHSSRLPVCCCSCQTPTLPVAASATAGPPLLQPLLTLLIQHTM